MEQISFGLSQIMQPAQEVVERSSDAAKHRAGEDATDEFFQEPAQRKPVEQSGQTTFRQEREPVVDRVATS